MKASHKKTARTTHRAIDRASPAPTLAIVPPTPTPEARLSAIREELWRVMAQLDVLRDAMRYRGADYVTFADAVSEINGHVGRIVDDVSELMPNAGVAS